MTQPNSQKQNTISLILSVSAPILFMGLLVARAARPQDTLLSALIGILLIGSLGGLIYLSRAKIRARTVTYGTHWLLTLLLTIAIVGVVNFVAFRNPKKLDLTQGKINTLSEQTEKVVQAIQQPVKFTYFARPDDREKNRPMFENYRALNSKIEVENLDSVKEGLRAQALGIRSENTLLIKVGAQENRVESPNEEKITNALIRLTQGRSPVVCSVVNHGEKDLNSSQADGFMVMKKTLEQQNYALKDINLVTEGKVPADCSAVLLLGPKSAFLDQEIEMLRTYFNQGGRGVLSLDINIRGQDPAPQLMGLLKEYGVESAHALLVDPVSARNNLPLDVAPIANLNEHPITKDLKEIRQGFLSPATRPLKILSPAPEGLKVEWLAQSTPESYAKSRLDDLSKGAVGFQPGDLRGPHSVAVAISGKPRGSTAKDSLRIVVLGSTMMGANNFAGLGRNVDFFANAVSWSLDNENLISIRPKEERDTGKLDLSQTAANLIGLVSIVIAPLLVMIAGIVVSIRRRRL